jgi:NADPH-dependent 2,4-dienoyl-CoA reductase/sulfur reductase-like enzyme/Fe-S-cluster-containing hydrogenase component 2
LRISSTWFEIRNPQSEIRNSNVRTIVTFNRERCLACRACELACSVIHSRSGRLEAAILEELPPKRRVLIAAGRNGIEALRCEQCLEPLCAFSCKSGALRRDPRDGRVVFDERRCIACFMCLMVCPFGVRPDPARDRVVRCDVCSAGVPLARFGPAGPSCTPSVPACVAACPTGALGTQAPPDERARSGFRGQVVVVGSSAAGIAACEAAREHAPDCSITLATADASPQYSRPLLPYLLGGRIGPQDIDWRTATYLEDELGVRVRRGVRAIHLDQEARSVALDDGTEVAFDRLILATGGRATLLSISGAEKQGVCSLRNAEDLETIDRLVSGGGRAVVLGGGNVGLQACEALLARGLGVTVVVKSPHLLSQMVDAEAGGRVAELFARHGANIRTGRDAAEIAGNGRVESVRLDDGECLPADLVLMAKGITPNVEWLRDSGLRMGRGIVIDCCGRTSREGIFAAGDCAELIDPLTGRSAISGIWPVAYETGRAAGSTAVGVERACGGALRMNAARFFDVPIISIGEVCPERLEGTAARVLARSDSVYRKLVLRRGRLAGALLFGDISGAGILYRLYRDQTQIDEEAVVAAGLCRNVVALYAAVCEIADRPAMTG